MIRTIDYAALGSPVTKPDVAAFRAELSRTKPDFGMGSWIGVIIVSAVVVSFGAVFLGIIGPAIASVAQSAASVGAAIAVLLVPLLIFAAVITAIVLLVRYVSATRVERWVRLDRFAKANGLVFSPADANPQYPGAIFGQGRARSAYEHFRSASDRFLDFGNYRYTTGSGKNSTTHTWGFMALQLDRALPHMVLDSKANNGLFGSTNLPATFTKDQVLSLEGDFDNYFTLYCPKQYERDALYVFTPDLMALCIDNAAPFDIEIVDKWMFVYSAAPFDMSTAPIYQRLFGIVDTVGAKTLSQTDHYADERVANFTANVVAPQGARLKRGVSVGAIVIGVVVIGFWIVPQIVSFLAFAASR
jgi:hypothetical protein